MEEKSILLVLFMTDVKMHAEMLSVEMHLLTTEWVQTPLLAL